ncbi:putative Arf GTPase activating protein [Helianthus annuus]|uniref:Arf GTPase activating protein n=1 Tax=Helianthus annuus TaxID=4232 RepID=A0A251V297_HELAN|nr:probable ADP-ribosylation factor GTPase-activating protein AGD14 isoform X2 [Helianthus annuus]KAF5812076.1 putative Arf GTPase activating protein [Helianthus annuus]KAJ0598654.1 putative Arf GTPase activating protein [Helianthus annuus]KAJ0759250.1 putative Arf GTPase activating protein [Helianthus annuus]KAJ0933194.1 putative Arf GTPase activating protein [Helianthus annuus]
MSSSRREEERNEKIIRGLMKLPPNRRCINCNSLGPQYVCTNFWTFVCMTCSGIHREFTHRVKSVSMSKFTSQEVEALQEGGNQRARETFLRDWDPREQRLPDNSNVDKVRDFIKSVYVDKNFFASKTSGKPPRDMLNHRNFEDETRRASSYHSYSQSPPYDYQYEERRYGKQAPVLTKKPGSDRGMFRFPSTSRLSDHVQEDRFAKEAVNARVSDYSVTSGGDLSRSNSQPPPSFALSHSSGSEKFDGLDLFSASNAPQSATSAPSAEPEKYGGLDLFSAPNAPQSAASAPSAEPEKYGGLDLFSAPNAPQSATSAPSAEPEKFGGLDLFTAPDPPQSATSAPSAEPEKYGGLDLFSAPNAPQSATSAPSAEPEKFGGLDLFTAPDPPQSATSAPSAEPEKFGGLDLFGAPNPPEPATSAPSAEPEKFSGLDLFELLATSSVAPTLSVNQEFKAFEPNMDLFTVIPDKQPTETLNDKSTDMITQKNDAWATFDMPWHAQPSQQDISVHDIAAPVNVQNNIRNHNQSWSSFEESTTPFESVYTKSGEQVPVQDPLLADPFLAWGISEVKEADLDARSTPFVSTTPHAIGPFDSSTEIPVLDGAQSHGPNTKSHNPFDFPSDTDYESSNMFFDMSSMQSALPTPWFPDSAAIPFAPGNSQEALVFMTGQAPSMQIPNIQAQGPVASVGGNPFG